MSLLYIKVCFIFSSLPSILQRPKWVRLLWILPQRKRFELWRSPTEMRKERCCHSLSEKQDGIEHFGKRSRCFWIDLKKAQFKHEKLDYTKMGLNENTVVLYSFQFNWIFLLLKFHKFSVSCLFPCIYVMTWFIFFLVKYWQITIFFSNAKQKWLKSLNYKTATT